MTSAPLARSCQAVQVIVSTLGLVPDSSSVVTTGCGLQVPYAIARAAKAAQWARDLAKRFSGLIR